MMAEKKEGRDSRHRPREQIFNLILPSYQLAEVVSLDDYQFSILLPSPYTLKSKM